MGRVTGLGLVSLAAAAGCFDSTAPPPVDQVTTAVEVVVKDEGGVAVGGPLVGFSLAGAAVNGVRPLLVETSILFDDSGRSVVTFVIDDREPQDGLAHVTVTPAPGRGLLTRDTANIPIRLTRGNPPRDTAFVEVVLLSARPSP